MRLFSTKPTTALTTLGLLRSSSILGLKAKRDRLTFARGIAHLWFVTIHPFEDGNGRIARAIDVLALAKMEGTGQRFYGVSARIQPIRKNYTARKWAALGKCSVDTANRDINDLLARGLLVRNPGGSRRTSFSVLGFE